MIAIVVFELREVSWFEHGVSESNRRLRNRLEMTLRHRFVPELNMALCANKRRALVSLVYLVIENSAFVKRRCNVATFGAPT